MIKSKSMKVLRVFLVLVFFITFNLAFSQAKVTNTEIKSLYKALYLENSLKQKLASKIQNQPNASIMFSNPLRITNLRINSIKNLFKFYEIREPKTPSANTKGQRQKDLKSDYKEILKILQDNLIFYQASAKSTTNSAIKSLFVRLENLTQENKLKLKKDWELYSAKIPN